jgi:hypothetical protein
MPLPRTEKGVREKGIALIPASLLKRSERAQRSESYPPITHEPVHPRARIMP